MATYIGSARHDEFGNIIGGKAGDQLQTNDTFLDVTGEVSAQLMYTHKKGWYVLRPKSDALACKLAYAMLVACNNKNIGYSQICARKCYDIATATPINMDCSVTVRSCIKDASSVDVGNFSTENELTVLNKSKLFEEKIDYITGKTKLYAGDVLVTRSKGHTAIVIASNESRIDTSKLSYYPACKSSFKSLTEALKSVGEKDISLSHRKAIATANSISNYKGSASQNLTMLKLLKAGKLVKV